MNHLLFADNCIIFGRANLVEWEKIQVFLSRYEKASGQLMNKHKTTICFSSNTSISIRRHITQATDLKECGSL